MSVNTISNQREITPKKQSRVIVLAYDIFLLCFMTHRINVLYNCMKLWCPGSGVVLDCIDS